MRYTGGLSKKERETIFSLFLEKDKLKFSEIEKALNIRSNMVSYHLEQMQKENLLTKKGFYYYLTKTAERYLPIFPHIIGKELSPLPVVLVALLNKDKILLLKRKKRPYRNYWGLIGGKMLLEESFEEASQRLITTKTGLTADFESINSVFHERVEGESIVKHSFILFFTKMTTIQETIKQSTYGETKWFSIKQLEKQKIIPSDRYLIKNNLNTKIQIKSAKMQENQGGLTSFKLIN